MSNEEKKKWKINFGMFPPNNLRKMRGLPMVRHSGKRHTEKWRDKDLPF